MAVPQLVSNFLCFMEPAIFFVLWNLEVYHCVQKNPPLFTVLSWISWVDTPSSIMLSRHMIFKRYILILSSHLFLGLKVASFCQADPPNLVCTSSLPHARFMPRSHTSSFEHSDNVWWGVQIIKLFISQLSPASCFFVLPRPKCSQTATAWVPPSLWETSLHTCQNNRQNYGFVSYMLYIFGC
jgi:hypothetical protein